MPHSALQRSGAAATCHYLATNEPLRTYREEFPATPGQVLQVASAATGKARPAVVPLSAIPRSARSQAVPARHNSAPVRLRRRSAPHTSRAIRRLAATSQLLALP